MELSELLKVFDSLEIAISIVSIFISASAIYLASSISRATKIAKFNAQPKNIFAGVAQSVILRNLHRIPDAEAEKSEI